MAKIINLEKNLEINICLKGNDMLEYDLKKSEYENYIPFVLVLNLPNRCSSINEAAKATMTIFELKNLIYGIENVLVHLNSQKKHVFEFNNSENFFELKLEVIPEDNVIEIELWINVGSQSNGKFFGFDEGVRLVIDKNQLNKFLNDFKQEFYKILKQCRL